MDNTIAFSFEHNALSPDDKVQVLSFKGTEGISRLYEFEIELLSVNPDIDIDKILETQASLTITLGNEERVIQGIISHCDAVSQVNNQTLYKAKLVPKLWELSLFHTNEIYLDQNIKEIIEMVLQEAGFTTQDYDLSGLQGNYRNWAYKCQYNESHLEFISRLMERDGIYYYFTQGEIGEKLVFCDSLQTQEDITNSDVTYSPNASLEINALANTITSFINQKKRLPHKVLLKDYNDDKPSVDIKGEFIVDESANPSSEIYVWGQNIQTPEEGGQLAQIRAEEISSTKSVYYGESTVIRLISGHQFTLEGHFRTSCNQDYLLLNIEHEAKNPSLLHYADGDIGEAVVYQNTFSAIPADIQYRSSQVTTKPEIHGTLNAFVDAEGDGHYAELDEEGRYRVTLPFDRLNRDGGKSSHWIRMSQPYGGEGQGMSFPLRKGTEVLLTFIGGDPDRPVIAGTVPNASQPSITTADNQTNSLIKTGSGNKIELEDQDGKNRIKLQTGDNKTYMHLGAPNHAGDGWVLMTTGMERKEVKGGYQSFVSVSNYYFEDGSGTVVNISDQDSNSANASLDAASGSNTESGSLKSGNDIVDEQAVFTFKFKKLIEEIEGEKVTGYSTDGKTATSSGDLPSHFLNLPSTFPEDGAMTREDELAGNFVIERRIGERYVWSSGNEYIYGADKIFDFGNSWDEFHINEDGIDDNEEYFGADMSAISNALNTDPDHLADGTTGLYNWGDETRAIDPENQIVEMKWGDEYEYHHGRRFEWCSDPADYAFGNGYVESLINSNTETINATHAHDKASPGGPRYGDITSKHYGFTLSRGTTSASKEIGNSYNYKNGDDISITVGNSDSETYGNAASYTDGDTYDVVMGNSYTKQWGRDDTFFMGGTSEFKFAASSTMSLAATSDLFLGLKNDICIAARFSLDVAACTDVVTGLRADISAGIRAEISLTAATEFDAVQIKTKLTELKNSVSNLSTTATKIETAGAGIKTAGAYIGSGLIRLLS
ncbi:type VI secretion system tip protein TssI/VgrG [Psychrosphaera sp. 1_MG-2023]|uniref:type VI secretion system Vgr family protein n=1 Tax=Psychrosphaera sp. 1_MG-2023 TaxID=3062643 RepID=UPI0026E18049|nr:type VI secretion system tip protein TssI/VgrG [Psychrosphaera sp. 1_MG-2023]MDO6721405.1 type VI secretion system tip protein TssI/VgrG [Psychrosphaera sp. 1_MG-2023]